MTYSRMPKSVSHDSLIFKFHFNWLVIFLIFILIESCAKNTSEQIKPETPNILLILADDLGYADLGCFGGMVETPHIDSLAARGIRFSRFHTSPLCAPTRSMLLSGNDNHIAGMGLMGYRSDIEGYEGCLTNRIATIPEVLKMAGYHTYMAGKWHLGTDSLSNPSKKGFEHSFVNLLGAGNHYDDKGLFSDFPVTPYTEDGKPAPWKNGNYSTDFFTDKIIEYIDLNKANNKPFFAFAAYTSPHWPLQVDEKYWKKYKGKFDAGYDALKKANLETLKQAGMIPENAVLPPNSKRVKPWNTLSEEQKKIERRKMELYAGMVDNLDFNIGRLIDHLRTIGKLENTLIVVMSDNGAAAEDFYYSDYFGPFLKQQQFNDEYEDMGKPNSFISYGPQWAEAGSSPFKFYKGLVTEGGINTPIIMAGPGVQLKNKIEDAFVTVMDLAPTFYDLAKTSYPDSLRGKAIFPLKGNSLVPLISGKSKEVHNEDYVFGLEHDNIAMIRKGSWKITNLSRPFVQDSFKLYNLQNDLAEIHDLKQINPEKYQELIAEWLNFKEVNKVRIPFETDEQF
ncbi:arylsulfatase [Gaetbulibacter aestuarii]|uniref:Arylsulfatase n=1 Tax=Gaetbulibacter aestuarii TaxID=1502358 RepID=A0ABW7MX96_9FLAO